jgi:hypothetical protein
MIRIFALPLLAAAAFAQGSTPAETPLKPPAEKVDKALRARITEFYKLQAAGKHRDAEALVAKDTKDYYYSSGKTSYVDFEIKTISYFDKYQRASAVISTQRYLPHPDFAGRPFTVPITSKWKIENGKWVWYVDEADLRQTPFGVERPLPSANATPGAPLPGISASLGLAGKVRANVSAVALQQGESREIVFSSAAPGIAVVSLEGTPEGFAVSPNRVFIKQNETAKVTVKALPGAAAAALKFRIDPTGEFIDVTATVAK